MLLILIEILFIIIVVILSSQSSALWSSVSIIPLRISIVRIVNSVNYFSGIAVLLFIIVFIGGLLVLLVRVASISRQEQRFYFIKVWVGVLGSLIFPFLIMKKRNRGRSLRSFTFVNWFREERGLIILRLLFLLTALFLLTKLILYFKGMVRIL